MPKWDADHHSGDAYTIIPTINLNIWNVVKRKANGDYSFGELKNDTLRWIDIVRGSNHPAAEATKTHPDVSSFLYFSSYACPEVKKHAWGYEIRWIDVRYRHRRQYPFVAVVLLNLEYEAFDSYVGWLSDTRLEKKLRLNNS
ncbi:MAG: hypothetical protein A2189_03445 [Paenibacillus sp. RIFOXYA1_FULL_44_5]|nr:MAG: hypothetical protein A2189_03445 [Paenibacillus sp. RIFOXYA1_FULL_44_5]